MATRHDTTTESVSDEATPTTTDAPAGRTGRQGESVREYRGTGIIWSAVALLVAISLFVLVIVQNSQDVEFEFLWFDVAMPLSLILAITFGVALVVGEVTGFVWRRRRRTRLREREELRRLRSGS